MCGEFFFENFMVAKKRLVISSEYKRVYVEDNHLFTAGYAQISTDDRGIYFFTEGR